MIYTWKPSIPVDADGRPALDENGEAIKPLLEGTVTIELPKYIERLKYMRDANFKISANGQLSGDVDHLEVAIKAVELAEKRIKEVNLTIVSTGVKVTTVDQMQYSSECSDALSEIGFLIINGPELGNR